MANGLGDDLVAPFVEEPPKRIYVSPNKAKATLPGEELPAIVPAQPLVRGSVLPQMTPAQVDAAVAAPPPAEARSYEPDVSTKLGDLVRQGLLGIGMTPQASQHLGDRTKEIAGYLPLLGDAIAAGDVTRNLAHGDYPGAAIASAGLVIPGAGKAIKAARGGKKAVQAAEKAAETTGEQLADTVNPRAVIGGNNPPPEVTGKLNPLANEPVTFGGKQPSEFTPEDWQAFGQHYGTDKPLGPLSTPQTYKTTTGQDFVLPGGTEGEWTYADLLHMKANPINPAEVDRTLHAEMQRKLGRTMTPKELSDADVWNGLVFGMTSPNNPLFPNQVAASRLRMRTPELLDDLSSMIPWKPGEKITPQQRLLVSDNIARRYGLASAEKGGLGVRGSADYSRVGEMAQMFKQNPGFFRKAPDEDWGQAVERISSQLPGLSMKTGSFGTVWQDPAHAAISAIDRHMARELEQKGGGIFADAAERTAWQNRGVALWNKRNPEHAVDGWTALTKQSGSDGFIGEMLLDHVGNALTPKFRLKRTGEVNPDIPGHLAQASWVREPDAVFKMGQAYRRALDVNQKLADENGLNLFMSQWMEWDRIRNRFEPHENMFPGLSKTPAPSVEQLRGVDAAHRETGHKTYTKTDDGKLPPTRPFKGSASKLGYLGLGGAMAPAVMGERDDTAN
jgi:hypothetical protein